MLRVINSIGCDNVKSKNNLSILALYKRYSNDLLKNRFSKRYFEELSSITNGRIYIFYESKLPYYLLVNDSDDERYRINELKEALEIR